jgi:hypothetical protein
MDGLRPLVSWRVGGAHLGRDRGAVERVEDPEVGRVPVAHLFGQGRRRGGSDGAARRGREGLEGQGAAHHRGGPAPLVADLVAPRSPASGGRVATGGDLPRGRDVDWLVLGGHHGYERRPARLRDDGVLDAAGIQHRFAEPVGDDRQLALAHQDPDLAGLRMAPRPEPRQAVIGPDRPAHRDGSVVDVDPACQLGPRQFAGGSPVEGVCDSDGAFRGAERGLQDQRVVDVPAAHVERDRRREVDRTSGGGIEQGGAQPRCIHGGQGQPVDGPVGNDQRGAAHVPKNGIAAQRREPAGP